MEHCNDDFPLVRTKFRMISSLDNRLNNLKLITPHTWNNIPVPIMASFKALLSYINSKEKYDYDILH